MRKCQNITDWPYGSSNSGWLLVPEGEEVRYVGGVLAGNSCWSMRRVQASFVNLGEVQAAAPDRALQPAVNDLCDGQTMSERLPGSRHATADTEQVQLTSPSL